MAGINVETLGAYVERWVRSAPSFEDLDSIMLDAQEALIEAGMVQYNPDGWNFKLHEKHPEAPKAQFKLMIREAPGVDTDPAYYDRFTLPSVRQAAEIGELDNITYMLGYPNAGTPIAEAFVRLAKSHFDIELIQLKQAKVTYDDGTRELGPITSEYTEGEPTKAIDDTATGGDTKIEGWKKIKEHRLTYRGLLLIVERDPLGTALIRERTGARVDTSIHWMTLVKMAGRVLDLPEAAIRRELDYPFQLFEWNASHNNLDSVPSSIL